MSAASQHLALIDSVITKRGNADAYESYTEGEKQFRGTSLKELFAIRTSLKAEVAAESGGDAALIEFINV